MHSKMRISFPNTLYLMISVFPDGNVSRSQLSVSRDQRRLCSGSAQGRLSSAQVLLTLFMRHGAFKANLNRNHQLLTRDPKSPSQVSVPKSVTIIRSHLLFGIHILSCLSAYKIPTRRDVVFKSSRLFLLPCAFFLILY
jgi:hypothetical protein